VDARGNKPGVDAQFRPPVEQLAFVPESPEERTFPDILSDPLDVVVAALRKYSDWYAIWNNLPDWNLPSLTDKERLGSPSGEEKQRSRSI